MLRRATFLAASIAVAALAPSRSFAQANYPAQPIMMVVPFAAGGPSDVVARIVADGMSKVLGQSIVIENVGGAGGTTGTTRVANASPDGYTLLAASMGSHVAAPSLYANLKYEPTQDFEPIGVTAHAPVAIVAKKDFPAKDLKEFIAYVKENGAKVNMAHGGVGASSHMACLLFDSQLGLKPSAVAYRGTGQAINDLVSGQVDFFCEQVLSVAPAINGKLIKAYAVAATERSPVIPEVPTTTEAGASEYKMSIWSGLFAPKGTPKEIIDKLADALDKALDDPTAAKRLVDLGGAVPTKVERTPAHLRSLVAAEISRWSPLLKAASAVSN